MFTLTRRMAPVLVLDAVDGADRFENVIQRIAQRIFARLECQTLVPHVLQGDDLVPDLLLRQLFASDGFCS